ncbi:hypothetical protein FOMPIDRAFT_1050943 [Fomitopsis schrenkii]|uniref:Uncharacterized protein n=1 Tax=Fomitopsis schrenkii TaxID=2126942 RepID=S8E6B7_FOMSC|nr:hypothetical protein FOMPIDRAFT_1050943 [Fomitopsis schrenkii]
MGLEIGRLWCAESDPVSDIGGMPDERKSTGDEEGGSTSTSHRMVRACCVTEWIPPSSSEAKCCGAQMNTKPVRPMATESQGFLYGSVHVADVVYADSSPALGNTSPLEPDLKSPSRDAPTHRLGRLVYLLNTFIRLIESLSQAE